MDVQDVMGRTPIIYASSFRQFAAVAYLADADQVPDVNVKYGHCTRQQA